MGPGKEVGLAQNKGHLESRCCSTRIATFKTCALILPKPGKYVAWAEYAESIKSSLEYKILGCLTTVFNCFTHSTVHCPFLHPYGLEMCASVAHLYSFLPASIFASLSPARVYIHGIGRHPGQRKVGER